MASSQCIAEAVVDDVDLIYGGHDADAWKFLDAAWPAKVSGKDTFGRRISRATGKESVLARGQSDECKAFSLADICSGRRRIIASSASLISAA